MKLMTMTEKRKILKLKTPRSVKKDTLNNTHIFKNVKHRKIKSKIEEINTEQNETIKNSNVIEKECAHSHSEHNKPKNNVKKLIQTIKHLSKKHPKCFFAFSRPKVVLKIGILDDLVQIYLDEYSKTHLRRALKYYVENKHYLHLVVKSNNRFDLNGNMVDTISEDHKIAAKEKLKNNNKKIENVKMTIL